MYLMLSILYIVCMIILSYGNISIRIPTYINGVISSTMMILASLMTISSKTKKNFIICLILQIIEFSSVTISSFKFGNISSIPGISMAIFSLFQCLILKYYMDLFTKDEKKLNDNSMIDSLTGLFNRNKLIKDLKKKSANEKKFYLMFCDLDNFKQLNDTLGHEAGDELLKEISKLWKNVKTTDNNTVYRLGGDEFAVIVEESRFKTEKLAEEMLTVMSKQKSKYFTYITASIGIASYPNDTNDIDKLLTYADSSMYRAKNNGKNIYHFFDREIFNEIKETYETEKYLLEAIKNDYFEIVYQPQYEVKSKKISGFESLVRLKKGSEILNTQNFILVAEKTGLIFDLDNLIFKKVLLETKDIVLKNPDLIFSINVSGKHIVIDGFVENLYNTILETNYSIKNIKLEITESAYIKQINMAAKRILKLKRLGIKIALDDFGVGYSSLNYLSKIPVNTLKIDKSFIDKITEDNSLVDLIIRLGHLMNCSIIAEGVETEDQFNMLSILGCDYIQGFLLGEPMPLEKIYSII